MAKTLTTNYSLGKWDDGDNPGATDLNANWASLDTQMWRRELEALSNWEDLQVDLNALMPPAYTFTVPDVLTTVDNVLIPWLIGRGKPVSNVTGTVKTAPTGASITVAIKLILRSDGSTVSTLGTLTIVAGSKTGDLAFTSTAVPITHALAAEITQVGSGTAGANMTVMVY